MLHHLRETLRRIPAPRRYGRIMALLLASLGGAVDVFSHMRYEALVATQTGNFILLIADLHRDTPHAVHLRWFSVIFFSCGYLGGHLIRDLLGQRHAPAVPCARRWVVSWAGQRVGSGRLKAPHIALPGYRNDSQ